MQLYALVEAGDPEAIDVYLTEREPSTRPRTACEMSPEWPRLFRVDEIDLAGASDSPN